MDRSLAHAAMEAQARNDPARADSLFRQHLSMHRDDAEVLSRYAAVCLQTGRIQAACYYFHRATRLRESDPDLWIRYGYALLRHRDPEAAGVAFERTLHIDPANPLALNGIGLQQMASGATGAAVEAFLRASQASPRDASLLVNAADACIKDGDPGRAVALVERARALGASDTSVSLDLARCLREAGRAEAALALLAAHVAPERQQAAVNLEQARCELACGRGVEARRLLERLARDMPGNEDVLEESAHATDGAGERHRRRAAACRRWLAAQRVGRAGTLIERMLAENEGVAETWVLKGLRHDARQEKAEAEAAFRKAIALDPRSFEAHVALACLLEQLNRVEDARALAEAAAMLVEQAGEEEERRRLRMLSCVLDRREARLPEAVTRLDALDAENLSDEQRMTLAFERGMVQDRLGEHAPAMAAFEAGNAIARRLWSASSQGPNPFLAEVDAWSALVEDGWLDGWPDVDAATDGAAPPVFLTGFPRSGTTLLTQVLESNSFVQTIDERATVSRLREIVVAMPEGYPHALPRCDREDLGYLRRAYADAVARVCQRDASTVLVDKNPLQTVRAALIHRVFPDARFLFVARHPYDVCLSCYMQNFRHNEAVANFFSLEDTVRLYVRSMRLWQAFQAHLPLAVHTVRYSALVRDFEAEARKACAFIGVPWQERQADFAAHVLERRQTMTPSYAQVSQPIYDRAIDRWEPYRAWFEPFEDELAPFVQLYG